MGSMWRALSDLAWPTAGAIIGVLVGSVLARRRAKRPTLPGRAEYMAAMRRLGGGRWRGRWRSGYITIAADVLVWRPRSSRPMPSIELPRPVINQRRKLLWHERWRLNHDLTVFAVTSRGERYEIAVASQAASLMNRIP